MDDDDEEVNAMERELDGGLNKKGGKAGKNKVRVRCVVCVCDVINGC